MRQDLKKQLQVLKYKISNPKYFTHPVLRPFLRLINWRKDFTIVGLDRIRENRKSDLLFILGNGACINTVTDEEWKVVKQHDSIASNYFLFHSFVPTYYQMQIGYNPEITIKLSELIQSRKEYKNVIRFVNSRSWRKGMHPRMLPELFIEGQTVCYFKYPTTVHCPASRPFRREDFDNRYLYRGSINLALYLALKLGYRRVVLLGCEMNKNIYFIEELKKVPWIDERAKLQDATAAIPYESLEIRKAQPYEGMYVKKNKHPFDVTIHAFNEFVFKPEGVELFVARKESIMFPKIPYVNIVDLAKCG